jgi:hypothetical protein
MGNHNSADSEGLFDERSNQEGCRRFYAETFQSLVLECLDLDRQPEASAERYLDLYGRVTEAIDRLPEHCSLTDELPYRRFSEHIRWKIQRLSAGGAGVPHPPSAAGHRFDDTVTVFAGRFLAATPAAPALEIVRRTPVIPPRLTLTQQMDLMLPYVQEWLLQLGRNPNYGQVLDKNLEPTGKDLYMELGGTMPERKAPDDRFVLGGRFALSGREVNELRDAARYSVGAAGTKYGSPGPDSVYRPSRENDWDYEDIRNAIKRDEYQALLSTLVGVTGPVYVMFDNDFAPQTKGGRPITLVSVAGLSFQRDRAESRRFTEVTDGGERRIRPDAVDDVQTHLGHVMHHIFQRYQRFGCEVPVLCAIGCGVFAAGVRDVPGYYARSMAHLLSRRTYGFAAVVVALVTPADFVAFRAAFADVEEGLRTTVILTLHRSMIHVADRLARANIHAGMLNPSDPIAVRSGYLGYQFDGGHAALEEILGLQTTLLLHHKGSNPTLYTDPGRFARAAAAHRSAGGGPLATSYTSATRTDRSAVVPSPPFFVPLIGPL